MKQGIQAIQVSPVGLYDEPAVVDAVEEQALKMARKETEIMGYLWARKGERFGTGDIAEATQTPLNSCYRYLMRLWDDGLVSKRRAKLGQAIQWWME